MPFLPSAAAGNRCVDMGVRPCSVVPGRQRWDVKPVLGRPRTAEIVAATLRRVLGITDARANPVTGGVLVRHDVRVTATDVGGFVRRAVTLVLEGAARPPAAAPARPAAEAVPRTDLGVRIGEVDALHVTALADVPPVAPGLPPPGDGRVRLRPRPAAGRADVHVAGRRPEGAAVRVRFAGRPGGCGRRIPHLDAVRHGPGVLDGALRRPPRPHPDRGPVSRRVCPARAPHRRVGGPAHRCSASTPAAASAGRTAGC